MIKVEVTETIGGRKFSKQVFKYGDRRKSDIFDSFSCTFDLGNPNHDVDSKVVNLMFLRHQQQYANDKLKTMGYLFLNEVYEILGLPKSALGQIVGWLYNEHNRVDFGIWDKCNDNVHNGDGYEIQLTFNVDGIILDAF